MFSICSETKDGPSDKKQICKFIEEPEIHKPIKFSTFHNSALQNFEVQNTQ